MPIRDVLRKNRWYGMAICRHRDEDIKRVYELKVEGNREHGGAPKSKLTFAGYI